MMKKILSDFFSDYERPFFVFLTVVLVVVYGQTVSSNAHLRQPLTFSVFTLLMAVHIALYWMMSWILRRTAKAWLVLVIQGILAYILVVMAQTIGVAFGLFPGLIDLAIGIYRSWRAIFPAAYYLGLSLLSALTIIGSSALLWWAVGIIPASLFAAIYVALYSRQSEARERAQALAEELAVANRQLSEYTARVEDLTITAERERMARELHDSLSQGLVGLILQLEAADAHLTNQRSEKARLIIQQAMQRARLALSDARRIIGDLRENDMGDLRESLQREISRFETATGILSMTIRFTHGDN
jgi:NarL family two-component system sensor histidine kinase YdfH